MLCPCKQLPKVAALSRMALKETEHSSVISLKAQDQMWRRIIYEKAYYLKLSQYGRLFSKIQEKKEQMVINNGRVGSWMKYLVLLI